MQPRYAVRYPLIFIICILPFLIFYAEEIPSYTRPLWGSDTPQQSYYKSLDNMIRPGPITDAVCGDHGGMRLIEPSSQRPRVFDVFLFNDELDLLEIRMNELAESVDKFVIIEGRVTFTGRKRTLVFKEAMEQDRFKKYAKKTHYHIHSGRVPYKIRNPYGFDI